MSYPDELSYMHTGVHLKKINLGVLRLWCNNKKVWKVLLRFYQSCFIG